MIIVHLGTLNYIRYFKYANPFPKKIVQTSRETPYMFFSPLKYENGLLEKKIQ